MAHALSIDQLNKEIDLSSYDFETTKELEPSQKIIGQERAVNSLEFGLDVDGIGYNLYVAGPPGIGKMSAVVPYVKRMISKKFLPISVPWLIYSVSLITGPGKITARMWKRSMYRRQLMPKYIVPV